MKPIKTSHLSGGVTDRYGGLLPHLARHNRRLNPPQIPLSCVAPGQHLSLVAASLAFGRLRDPPESAPLLCQPTLDLAINWRPIRVNY